MKNSIALLVFSIHLLLTVGSVSAGHPADLPTEESSNNRGHLVWLFFQGERLEISQDFRVRLDQRRLRVALANRQALVDTASEELLVALIQPGRPAQKVRIRGDEPIAFEDVQDGLGTLVVLGATQAVEAQPVSYAAIAFFAESQPAEERGDEGEAGDEAGMPLEVPLATIDPSRIRNEVSFVSTNVHAQDVNTLRDYDLRPRNFFRVERTPRGSIIGRFQIPENQFRFATGQVEVTVLRNGRAYAETVSGPDGRFEIGPIDPGFYSLFAVGRNGHAAFSIEVVDRGLAALPAMNQPFEEPGQTAEGQTIRREGEEAASVGGERQNSLEKPAPAQPGLGFVKRQRVRFVNNQLNAAAQLDILLIPPSLMDGVITLIKEQYGPPDDEGDSDNLAAGGGTDENTSNATSQVAGLQGGGGSSSGGGGGGGGGAGSAGGGGFAAVAGLAAIAGLSALAGDDDGFDSSLSTPIAP